MEETGEPSPPFAIVLSNLWIAYGFIQTVLERRPGDVHRLVRVVIEFQQVREQKGLCYSIYSSPGGRCPGGADEGRTGNLKPNLREM